STSTTFIVPYREKSSYSLLLEEVRNLRTELYLFLRWLKRIEGTDEVSGQKWAIENKGETKEGFTVLEHDGKEQWFKFFRRVVEVPEWVRDDRDSQEYRQNVIRRDIAIAFSVDSGGNLAPSVAGAMYGGVYSFLPLGEARSGAKFPIQADFLVQPGRDAINYEAKWNHWLVEEIAALCQEAILYFKQHEKWKYQFLPAFEFTKTKGLESYERLFGPKLIEPIEKFLEDDECVPTVDGGWAKPKNVVQLNETPPAIDSLISRDILARAEIATVMGGQAGLKIAHPNVKERDSNHFKQIDRLGLLDNDEFLKSKAGTPDAAGWFSSLYLWLRQNPAYVWSGRVRYPRRYHDLEIVLTADRTLRKGGEVFLLDNSQIDPSLADVMNEFTTSRPLVHPDVLNYANNAEDQKALRGFLTGLAGVQLLDSRALCKEAFLPKILVASPKPASDEIVKYTTYCKTILEGEIPKGTEFWVLTKFGDIRAAKQVFFSKEFRPEQDWERYQQYIHGLSFMSPSYVALASTDKELKEWREFFRAGGVKDAPDNGVEEFAVKYAEDKLKAHYMHITPVEKRNYGYDLEAKTASGETVYIEVKGRTSDTDIELTGNETEAADKHGDTFYLCVVSSIPNHPAIYMVKNPSRVGKKEKLTIPVKAWKAYPWS
ncbi:MAG TPA: DUF3883 domain-containing protein, partial [Nitrososphaera sp.]|nr:DUF3883 domain-containing protein [Nitrososphaera sp.]